MFRLLVAAGCLEQNQVGTRLRFSFQLVIDIVEHIVLFLYHCKRPTTDGDFCWNRFRSGERESC